MGNFGFDIIVAGLIAVIYFLTTPKFEDYECEMGITFKQYWQRERGKILPRAAVVFCLWVLVLFQTIGYPQDILLALAATVAFEDFCFCGCTSRQKLVIPCLILLTTVCFMVMVATWA